MTKKSEAKLKFLKTEMVFPDEMKNIFHHSQRNFSFRNRLRPDSVSCVKLKEQIYKDPLSTSHFSNQIASSI